MTESLNVRGSILVVLSAVLWAINGNIGAYLFKNYEMTPEILTMFRLILSGLILLSYEYIKQRNAIFNIFKTRTNFMRLLYFGFFGLLAMQYSYFVATKFSNAATATILQSLSPFIIVVIGAINNRKKPSKEIIISLTFALIGVFLLITHGKINQIVITKLALVFGLIAAIGSVNYNLSSIPLQEKFSINLILGWAMFIAGIGFTIVFNPLKTNIEYDLTVIMGIFYVVILGTLVPFLLYLLGSKVIGPQKASIIGLIEPVAAALISVLFLNEKFKIYDYIGIGLVIYGLFLLIKSDSNKEYT